MCKSLFAVGSLPRREQCALRLTNDCARRPLNADEQLEGTPSVVTCRSERNEVLVRDCVGQNQKTFTFDRVYGQFASQQELFDGSIVPIIEEVLAGFNCTVFAYGQTGTGKTYTMEGVYGDPVLAGVIPRAIDKVFVYLQAHAAEYSVRVSFLELYNEELKDLLVDKSEPLKILEDTRRGVTTVVGQEEALVGSPEEVYSVMQRALMKRKMAETELNVNSSRSHCIFTLTIHTKETTVEGEDLLKVGKLNLVDLAGSECIGRSGGDKLEVRSINRSLHYLGLVINALATGQPFVPYRDSKLTRLLKDSLGGGTKTCIITTLSPSIMAKDVTLKTLEYAHSAKKIENHPTVNQKMTKRALLREYETQIEALKTELQAQREKSGVYVDCGRYQEMLRVIEGQKDSLTEVETELNRLRSEIMEVRATLADREAALESTTADLVTAKGSLVAMEGEVTTTKTELASTVTELGETRVLLGAHATTEKKLTREAVSLTSALRGSIADVHGLRAKIDRKAAVEAHNVTAATIFRDALLGTLDGISDMVTHFSETQATHHSELRAAAADYEAQVLADADSAVSRVRDMQLKLTRLASDCEGADARVADTARSATGDVVATVSVGTDSTKSALRELQEDVQSMLSTATTHLDTGKVAAQTWASRACAEADAAMAATSQFVAALTTAMVDLRTAVVGKLEEHAELLRGQEAGLKTVETTVAASYEAAIGAMLSAIASAAKDAIATGSSAASIAVAAAVSETEAARQSVVELADNVTAMTQHVASVASTWRDGRSKAAEALKVTATADAELVCGHIGSGTTAINAASSSLGAQVGAATTVSSSLAAAAAEAASNASAAIMVATEQATSSTKASIAALGDDAESTLGWLGTVTSAASAFRGVASASLTTADAAAAAEAVVLKDAVACAASTTSDLVASGLATDVPTGETPQRRDFVFPTTLSATSPYDRILARHRSRKALVLDVVSEHEGSRAHTEGEAATPTTAPQGDTAAVPSAAVATPPLVSPVTQATSSTLHESATDEENVDESGSLPAAGERSDGTESGRAIDGSDHEDCVPEPQRRPSRSRGRTENVDEEDRRPRSKSRSRLPMPGRRITRARAAEALREFTNSAND